MTPLSHEFVAAEHRRRTEQTLLASRTTGRRARRRRRQPSVGLDHMPGAVAARPIGTLR